MHPVDLVKRYASRKQRIARGMKTAASDLSRIGKGSEGSWPTAEDTVANQLARLQATHDFAKPDEPLIALDAMTERAKLGSRLGKECFDHVTRMGNGAKAQLRAMWLCDWVRKGVHPEAITNACDDDSRSTKALDALATECAATEKEAAKAKEGVGKNYRPDATRKREPKGARLDDTYARAEELQRQLLKKIAPHGEAFAPRTDYIAMLRRIGKEYRAQARQRKRRSPAGGSAADA